MRVAIVPALTCCLPAPMDSPEARAMILAVSLQESQLEHRRQLPRRAGAGPGPARGFPQFETVSLRLLLKNPATSEHLRHACASLTILPNVPAIHRAVEFQDVLGACCARLLLWALPHRLPLRSQPEEGWQQYLAAWNPGCPRPVTWAEHYARAWQVIGVE